MCGHAVVGMWDGLTVVGMRTRRWPYLYSKINENMENFVKYRWFRVLKKQSKVQVINCEEFKVWNWMVNSESGQFFRFKSHFHAKKAVNGLHLQIGAQDFTYKFAWNHEKIVINQFLTIFNTLWRSCIFIQFYVGQYIQQNIWIHYLRFRLKRGNLRSRRLQNSKHTGIFYAFVPY